MLASRFAQRQAKRLLRGSAALVVLASAASFAFAQPKPTLEYVFSASTNLTKAGGITDSSPTKANGTEFSGGTEASIGPGHLSSTFAIYLLGDNSTDSNLTALSQPGGTGIDTGVTTTAVGIAGGPFTVMAWINRFAFKGDNMVFGTESPGGSGPDLHLGFRKEQAYSGFWGNDSGAIAPTVGIYEWHHFAVRYDGTSVQSIFIDGVPLNEEPGHAAYVDPSWNLSIGHTWGNSGAFAGAIEHPRVYGGVALRDDQILADAQDMPIPP
jgi:hypothetical protein